MEMVSGNGDVNYGAFVDALVLILPLNLSQIDPSYGAIFAYFTKFV